MRILAGVLLLSICVLAVLLPSRPVPVGVEPLPGFTGPEVGESSVARADALGATSGRKRVDDPPMEARRAERGPVLLTGQVLDDHGVSVPGASVVATAWADEFLVMTTGGMPSLGSVADLQPEGRKLHREKSGQTKLAVVDLGDARFEVRGWTPFDHIHLRARRGKQRSERIGAVGDHAFVMRLERIGQVHAVLHHEHGISPRSFEVRLVSRHASPSVPLEIAAHEIVGQRVFVNDTVPAGRYDLEVRLCDNAVPLLRVEGLEVRADERCPDERLSRIDTRGLCRQIVVHLVRPNGGSLPLPVCMSADVVVLDPNGDPHPGPPRMRQSRIEFTTSHAYVDLRVEAPGYRTVHLPVLRTSRTVEMEPE